MEKNTTNLKDKRFMPIGILATGVLIAFFTLLIFPDAHESIRQTVFMSVLITALIWVGTRQMIMFTWKRLPWDKHPVKHLMVEIVILIVYPVLVLWIITLVYNLFSENDVVITEMISTIIVTIFITFFITSIYEGVNFYKNWTYNKLKSEKLEKENLSAKYQTLKNQVNPHFLFNSLNTLMSYVEENPKASEFVQNLSDFFRYVLSSRDKEVVLLRDEIKIVNKYIFLQQSRFGENLKVNLNVPEKYYHYTVAPLAVQMVVENAIKHNIKSKEKPLTIEIGVSEKFIEIKNNLQKVINPSSTGLGLVNIKNRYKYLTEKEVIIEETDKYFRVSLPLVESEF